MEYKVAKMDLHEQYNIGQYLNHDIAVVTVR